MNEFITIIFMILFLILCSGFIYLLFDYIKYKDDVDGNITNINTSVTTVKKTIDTKVNSYDEQLSTINNEHSSFSSNITNNVDKINNLDNNLQHYFKFSDNNNAEQNQKIFEHTFSGIEPNLEILSRTTVINGLNARTSVENKNDKNFKICNDANQCMYMNIDANNRFNLTPDENISSFVVNSKNSDQPFTTYDFDNNNLYFGGSDMNNSPMFMSDGELYLNNFNIIKKDEGVSINKDNLLENSLKYNSVESYRELKNLFNNYQLLMTDVGLYIKNILDYINSFISDNEESIREVVTYIQKITEYPNHFGVYYIINNNMMSVNNKLLSGSEAQKFVENNSDVVVSTITLKILPKTHLKSGDSIRIALPKKDFGIISEEKGDENVRNNLNNKYFLSTSDNITLSDYSIMNNSLHITIKDSPENFRDELIMIYIRGMNIIQNSYNSSISGISVGIRKGSPPVFKTKTVPIIQYSDKYSKDVSEKYLYNVSDIHSENNLNTNNDRSMNIEYKGF